MTPEQIKNIGAFVQFNRETQEQQGSGMGLTIIKLIAQIYNQDFVIESNYGFDLTAKYIIDINYQEIK